MLGLDGSPLPPVRPVTHFVRITAVNQLGIGKFRSMPTTYGVNGSGQRVVVLSELMNDPQEIDAFIRMSGLPIDAGVPDRLGPVRIIRRFPPAPEMRAQLRSGLIFAAPLVLLLVIGLPLIFLAVH